MYLGDDTYDDATDAELRPEWRTPVRDELERQRQRATRGRRQ